MLILENRDRWSDDDPTHNLFFVEMPDRRQAGSGAQRQTDERNAVPAAQPQASSSRQPAPAAAAGVLPFLYKPKHEIIKNCLAKGVLASKLAF